jgi:[ribosomal protein S5]-alanine N-acetyltransferase
MIFHLTSEAKWKKAQSSGEYIAESLATEGFIHLSSYGQILQVANLFYKSVEKPVLLALDNMALDSSLKWEGVNGLEFPHLYRPINISEVIDVVPLVKINGDYVSNLKLDEVAEAKSIFTERLILREFQLTDIPVLHEYASDEDLVKYMPWGPNSEIETQQFFTRNFKMQTEIPRKIYDFAVVEKSTGDFLGSGGIILQTPKSEFANIGYILKRSAQGKGYATEMSKAFLKFGFEKLKLHRIAATCDSENKASYRVMEKVGMKCEGLLREDMRTKGRLRSTFIYSILSAEYFNQS